MKYQILAAVDLGSNSFRLQFARVEENDQLYMLDSLREPVRLAAGLTPDSNLDVEAQQRGIACLQRFGERLRGLPPDAVRAVGTNSLRVARNAAEFLLQAETALGFPIEVIAGREEARLIYLGVAHGLPPSDKRRLVIDIGGGSTEFIIGSGFEPVMLESLFMGCVSFSQLYFPNGIINKANLKQADIAALNELQAITLDFSSLNWEQAFGSSGTARVICDLLEMNGYSSGGITRSGLEKLRAYLLKVGDMSKVELQGMKADRVAVLPGGFAILYAAFCEFGIDQMQPATGALREGVLYDLLGRFQHNDMRDVTVQQFMKRYHVATPQAKRVARLADTLARQFLDQESSEDALRRLGWAASLHEIGISVAHSSYHKHSAYILKNADMPGFSKREQEDLSLLSLAHRGKLKKLRGMLDNPEETALIMSLRLAALFCRNRRDIELPTIKASFSGGKFQLLLPPGWLEKNPLTDAVLHDEARQWKELGVNLRLQDE